MPVSLLALMYRGAPLRLPLSWSERMGYWTYATARIAEHPLKGWGLDASRTFGAAIGLHPHNGAIQAWLELGALGAALMALAWALAFRRLARDDRSLVTAATAVTALVVRAGAAQPELAEVPAEDQAEPVYSEAA